MIELTKDMEIGVPKIDDQHRMLVERLNTLTGMGAKAVSKEETQKTLDLLDRYVVEHFRDEEELQIESGYPKYEWHKSQHQLYIIELENLKKEFDANGFSVKFTMDLNFSIIGWIVRHIKTVDGEFGKYYREKNGL
jgi:hemerythrin